ncbi:hypothetical protein EMIHUDRAFT_449548 [Emiliania huxleyi CCMP1516]|uniref:TLC domain-containing protein n=2 Tax=Emiliania huxleyi TaxID=2903 RepID=A0A0D3K8T7_EMIH1|nr:hypothetical protein EMIHUDRAFT_459713 [Emiliania huxleyi CCMP1516]XP_005784601.1 hypothetical protein EMIHUDRAFT_449548 [Emiliania huxleyi CCMP1516]EOD11979.1 hypothetical protein EMIHUDRAFT_459713 [Emiliania huxleyi CCMP1516]EOD32172.1 hypothetical protein EMIHUDRAFT_449548 [Emiliania huxleyi CCMP1516]|eukprot:XP_005764408.1 hypothetical protein EMIHUDRAFT_459713 [Emiliania huxleyi CCMP1516]
MYLSVLFGTGLACATAQAFFTLLFARLLPDGIWRREPGFLAHQAVGLPLMLIVAGVGTVAWFFPDEASQKLAATPEGRVHGDFPTSDWLVSLLLGELLLWDIPMSAFPSLRSAASVGHHVMMALACVIALQPYLLYYVPFFGGVIELSSIPLQVVDVLHPKHFVEWTDRPRVAQLNAACRVAFAALFLLTRTALFPFVVFGQVLPDLYHVASRDPDERVGAAVGSALAVGFLLLQLYWSRLILRQILKRGGEGGSKASIRSREEASSPATAYSQLDDVRGHRAVEA